jgi:hypothetical protein
VLKTQGKACIVLSKALCAGMAAGDPAELGELEFRIEVVAVAVQHRGHPPAEMCATPDATERGLGVAIDECVILFLEKGAKCRRE